MECLAHKYAECYRQEAINFIAARFARGGPGTAKHTHEGETMTTTYTPEALRQKTQLARFQDGTLVFWGGKKPYWVIEWQADNGPGCYREMTPWQPMTS